MPGLDATKKLLLAFVTLIIGIMLIAPLATQSNIVTEKTVITDEVVSVATAQEPVFFYMNVSTDVGPVANVPSSWKIEDCPLTSITVTNLTGTSLTVTTDYTLSATTGVLNILNTTATVNGFTGSNSSIINYTYCGDDYVNLSWGRTVLDSTIGFFGLALLLTSLALFYSIWKESGLA